MSRVLVMGYQLPAVAEGTIEARSYRTWQFVEPLLEAGHELCFIASHDQTRLNVSHPLGTSIAYHQLALQRRGWLPQADAICNDFAPDAILGVMFNNGLRATRLSRRRPLWIDLYGDKMSEAQIADHTSGSNRGRKVMFEYIRILLRNADKYSTCSTPQKYALVGQLGLAGRIDRHTMGYEFVHTILPGAPSKQAATSNGLTLRGDKLPQDAFIVLWCGGYNVWTDVDTLFQALEQAMEKNPRIHYVSAGAGVRLTNNNSYERLLEQIARSAHRDRFHMLGWQPSAVVPSLYAQAEVGINLDAFHYETQLGTRTRLVEMMHYGLPVITTLGCELSQIVQNQGLGLTFQIGDAAKFAEHILSLASNKQLQQQLAKQAYDYTNNELSFRNTTAALLEWIKSPTYAPDRTSGRSLFGIEDLKNNLRGGVRSLLWRLWALERGE